MLRIYHSNKLKIHIELISNLIKNNPLDSLFEQEIILVSNIGVSQWLQIELAQSLGIIANILFTTTEIFIWDIFTKVLPDLPKENIFSKSIITWKLMKILPSLLHELEFKPLKQYLNKDADKRKLHQLSTRIAELFCQYLVYRPQWLDNWCNNQLIKELSNDQLWQKRLWIELIDYTEKIRQSKWHLVSIYQKFIQSLNSKSFSDITLPKRIFIFGISAFPPIYLQILNTIGKYIDIHLMITNPCRYYWGDIQVYASKTKYEKYKLKDYYGRIVNSNKKNSLNILSNQQNGQLLINPLLVSWGNLGCDNIYLLSKLRKSNITTSFIDVPRDNLLHQIQSDILNLENHTTFSLTKENYNNSFLKRQLNHDDKSITFHSCHSKQREVEVLKDYLLCLFDEEPTLTPKDIIVMVADIDSYAAHIQGVFSYTSNKRHQLPFFISDRKYQQVHSILKTIISLLDLAQSRFTTEQVLALLEVPSVAKRFSISNDELVLLRRWIKESGIRWGLNDENIAMLELPVTGKNTWAFGLNRMLLGYAMSSQVGVWNKILPYDECRGISGELAGQLAVFIDCLNNWKNILDQERVLSEWLPLFQCLLNDFFSPNEQIKSVFIFTLQKWQKIIETGIGIEYEDKVPLSVIRDELISYFNNEKVSHQFCVGAVNFCSMIPMRSIPFKVICLLGMNDGIYPRSTPTLGFNLMIEQPQRGDRNLRDDDRYFFLEALSSASKSFYLSYIGYEIYDNKPQYPSVLVNELLDYISHSFYLKGDEFLNIDDSANKLKEYLVIKHASVPFATENYLPNSRYQSYATEWLSAAKKQGRLPIEFCTSLLPKLEYENEILLEHLISFYRHPIKAFFQRRLKVNFLNKEIQLPENEPFSVNSLQRYKFNKLLLDAMIYEKSLEELSVILCATGELPLEHFGKIYLEKQIKDMQPLADKIKVNYHKCYNKLFMEYFKDTCLIGQLRNIQKEGIIRYRPATLTIIDGISLWIEHLIFCIIVGSGESYYWGRNDSEWCFMPVEKYQAKTYLQQLIKGYQKGMNMPLPLLLKSGWKWLMSCYNKNNNQFDFKSSVVLKKAKIQLIKSLQGTYNQPGEINDNYISRVFSKVNDNLLTMIQKNARIYLLPMIIFGKK